MIKDGFYDIDTLKEKYGLQTEAEWYEALDELGDQHITKIRKLIDSGEDLTKNPRIKISTIHGVKGNERENVVVTTDLAGAAFDEYQKNSDDINKNGVEDLEQTILCCMYKNRKKLIHNRTTNKEGLQSMTNKDLFKGTTYNSLEEQVGGKHYRSMKIQPAEFINENKLLFAEGNAIKYICRHQSKGKEQDIKKAIHYLEMILERDYS